LKNDRNGQKYFDISAPTFCTPALQFLWANLAEYTRYKPKVNKHRYLLHRTF